MANELSEQIEHSARRTVPVVQAVTDARLGDPTPCSEYDVRDLLNHLFHVVVGFQALAAKGTADFSTTPDYLEGDWRSRFGEETDRLVAAWGEPGTLEGKSQGFGMPQRTVAQMVLGDLTVHGWDLARATGQSYAPDERVVDALLPAFAGMGPTAREMGVLGEEVPVPAGAPSFDRLLGLVGRDPLWKA